MICFPSDPYPFKFFKGCLPQILLGPFLDTLPHIIVAAVQEIGQCQVELCFTCVAGRLFTIPTF